MENKTFIKKFAMLKKQAKELQSILDSGTDCVRNGLIQPGESIFTYTALFKNGYYMLIEISVPEFDKEFLEEDDYFGPYLDVFLYNPYNKEVSRCECEYKNIIGDFELFDKEDNKYIVKILAV